MSHAAGERVGGGVAVALIDSGVNTRHSHVGPIAGGLGFAMDGSGAVRREADFGDRIGHGSALAGILRAKAGAARLYAVKIFHERLAADFPVLEAALRWAIGFGVDVVGLSLGTSNPEHRRVLERLVAQASAANCIIVASGPPGGADWFPASLPGVLGVAGDARCGWDDLAYVRDDPIPFRAHARPRPLAGPAERRNFHGHSFAAAHLASMVARLRERRPSISSQEVRARLASAARTLGRFGPA